MTAGRLVAELPFGFWTYLLGSRYAASPIRTGRLWPQLLSAVFPALPLGAQRADVERRLNAIRQLRNRIFHHEPIWRRADLITEYRRIIECVRWLSPELARSIAALDRFRHVHAPGVHRLLRRRATQLSS